MFHSDHINETAPTVCFDGCPAKSSGACTRPLCTYLYCLTYFYTGFNELLKYVVPIPTPAHSDVPILDDFCFEWRLRCPHDPNKLLHLMSSCHTGGIQETPPACWMRAERELKSFAATQTAHVSPPFFHQPLICLEKVCFFHSFRLIFQKALFNQI